MAKVMIVDDEVDLIEITKRTLLKAGYEVCTALNGRQALEILLDENPDLILIDIIMPGMDGVKAVEEMQKNESARDIPVIMISGKKMEMDMIKGLLVGPVSYIEKPFGPEQLLDKIKNFIK